MRAKGYLLFSVLTSMMMSGFGQTSTLELTFSAIENTGYVQTDSIRVTNRTQGGDTMLYWPDTVLSICYSGIPGINYEKDGFRVFQNHPNPVTEQTTVSFFVPEKDYVSVSVTEITGRVVLKTGLELDKGVHSFRFTPGSGNLYFFTACWRGYKSSIKMLNAASNSAGITSLDYSGSDPSFRKYKLKEATRDFAFSQGDELLCIGYAGDLQSGLLDSPEGSTLYAFQFATNIPCPGTPTVDWGGQVYNTIQIFSQCWLKENLNTGTMINGNQNQTDNGIIEKYCYDNNPDTCAKYGGLYQWNEIMQYMTQAGAQGICPPGWHIPADEEWKVLEGVMDSQYRIGDNKWDYYGWRGVDAGTNMKTASGWMNNGSGTDLYGFSGLPCGHHYIGGTFYDIGYYGYWWASTGGANDFAWGRHLDYSFQGVYRFNLRYYGFAVRCLRDD